MSMITTNSKRKRELNFELNLLPVFDILSVCICFLLMTVVWVQVGALKATQSMGGQAQTHGQNPPAVWAYLNKGGQVILNLKDVPASEKFARSLIIPGRGGQVDWNKLSNTIVSLSSHSPSVKTALIMPSQTIAYDDIVQLMDQMKRSGIRDVGISPL
jgi:biopolymer transport protein TolR